METCAVTTHIARAIYFPRSHCSLVCRDHGTPIISNLSEAIAGLLTKQFDFTYSWAGHSFQQYRQYVNSVVSGTNEPGHNDYSTSCVNDWYDLHVLNSSNSSSRTADVTKACLVIPFPPKIVH
jgi:hypothetical protein